MLRDLGRLMKIPNNFFGKARKIWTSSELFLMSYVNLIQGIGPPPHSTLLSGLGIRFKWKFLNWGILILLKTKM